MFLRVLPQRLNRMVTYVSDWTLSLTIWYIYFAHLAFKFICLFHGVLQTQWNMSILLCFWHKFVLWKVKVYLNTELYFNCIQNNELGECSLDSVSVSKKCGVFGRVFRKQVNTIPEVVFFFLYKNVLPFLYLV